MARSRPESCNYHWFTGLAMRPVWEGEKRPVLKFQCIFTLRQRYSGTSSLVGPRLAETRLDFKTGRDTQGLQRLTPPYPPTSVSLTGLVFSGAETGALYGSLPALMPKLAHSLGTFKDQVIHQWKLWTQFHSSLMHLLNLWGQRRQDTGTKYFKGFLFKLMYKLTDL